MVNNDKFEKIKHDWLLLRDLKTHPQVQRASFSEKWCKTIADNIDPDKFGELAVVKVGGKTFYYVFDGQHRMEAARRIWGDDQRVPCAVHEDCPLDKQAKIFLGQNSRLAITALDKWSQRILAHDEKVIAIQKVLEAHKLQASKQKTQGGVMAVAALERVVDRYGLDSLSRALKIIGAAWGRDPEAYDSLHIKGLGFLVHRFDGEMNDEELIKKMAKSDGPIRLVGMARNYAEAAGISVERAISEKLLQLYNKGRTTKRLELQ